MCVLSNFSCVRLCVTLWTVVHQAPLSMGLLQAQILEWVACPLPGDLLNPGIKPTSPPLQADSLPSEPPWRPKNTGVGSHSLLQEIFPTQELNQVSCIAGGFFTIWATRETQIRKVVGLILGGSIRNYSCFLFLFICIFQNLYKYRVISIFNFLSNLSTRTCISIFFRIPHYFEEHK